MEKRQLRHSSSKSNDWIKCQSKKRPGQYYMFNKESGETKWCSEFLDDDLISSRGMGKRKSPSPPADIAKRLRTPAQDRLKRLQHNIKKEHKQKMAQKQGKPRLRRSQEKDVALKDETENDEPRGTVIQSNNILKTKPKPPDSKVVEQDDCQPSTSKSALSVKMEKDTNKSADAKSQKTASPKKSNQISHRRKAKKRSPSNSTVDSKTTAQKRAKQDSVTKERDAAISGHVKDALDSSQRTTAALNIGSGIVSKIKAICKSTFSSYCNAKAALSQKPLDPCIKKANFKIPKKESVLSSATHLSLENKKKENGSESDVSVARKPASSAPVAIVMKGTATPNNGNTTVDFKAFALTATSSQLFGTPNNLIVPAYERGSANTRLERLRSSLRQQAVPIAGEMNTPTRLCASACSSALACVIRDSTVTNEDPPSVDDEAMDWMPIEDLKPETIKLSSNESSIAAPSFRSQELETMGEYYGTVNENLLRYAVEQKLDANTANGKWLNDCYYFVLDTNVLLQHLTFIEDLSHMKLCDTSGTVLYLPYSVLQELDKLKQFAVGDGTKVLAVRAIKYLNAKFEAKNKHLQAQSALSEREHLVEISSPDDRIINCCLQAKQHVDHVILLTEDINLRNKAICNNILVSTKSDLLAKHT